MIPLKHLSNFWITLGIPLINCQMSFDLYLSENYVIVATNIADQATTFSITDTKLVTLSTQDNTKLH